MVDLPLLPAARLSGRLLLPPALGGRESAVVVRRARAPTARRAASSPPAVDADGRWSVAEVPARRELLVEVPGVSRTVVKLEPGEAKHLEEDLADRTLVLAVKIQEPTDARAHVTALVTCEAERRGGEPARPALARARFHGGVGVVPGLRAGRAALEVEVEESSTGTLLAGPARARPPARDAAAARSTSP